MMGEWRLMQYAPKDYSQIIVYDSCLDIVAAASWKDEKYDEGVKPDWYWAWHKHEPNDYSDCSPDCWMALPDKPEGMR